MSHVSIAVFSNAVYPARQWPPAGIYSRVFINAATGTPIAAFFDPLQLRFLTLYRLRLIAGFCKKRSYRPALGCV